VPFAPTVYPDCAVAEKLAISGGDTVLLFFLQPAKEAIASTVANIK
jgi:hypothetical protein